MTSRANRNTTPDYRTWVRSRITNFVGVVTAASLALCLLAFVMPWALIALLPALLFGWIFLILVLARYRFSSAGGGYQRRIHALLIERATGGRLLDIGCGNGHLAIQLAKASPAYHVTGLDYWGTVWEYSKEACERNAVLEGVATRTSFVRGSAISLPFEDHAFDCVVSCLTFHEVRNLADRTTVLSEALRVLRPGGTFAFLDLFDDEHYYPDRPLILQRLAAAGGVDMTDTLVSSLLPLPFPLNGKRLLRYARLITGERGVLKEPR